MYYGGSPAYATGPMYYGGSPYLTGPVYYGAPTTSTSGYYNPPSTTPTPDSNGPGMDKGTSPRPGGTPASGNPPQARNTSAATLIVSLPADARLTIDDYVTRSTSAVRTFTTPPLEPGKDYEYTLKAERMRDGQPQVVTRRVSIRPGEETRVTLDFTEASVSLK
jgi:uncharacterized protein (TIGR03000 family)